LTGSDVSKVADRLFNPAFMTLLLARSAKGAVDVGARGLEFPLAFVMTPLVMHPASREALPYNTTATSLLAWAHGEGQQVLLDLPARARALVEPTRAAINFALRSGVLELDGDVLVTHGNTATRNLPGAVATDDAKDCLNKATKVGKLFGKAGTAAFVYSTLGLRP
jgi:hypothetical protein